MDSFISNISRFDSFDIPCPLHNLPSIGICAEYYCPTSRFICMKCIHSNQTCVSSKNHELISFSELLYRFFIKQENKTVDLAEINSLIEVTKDYDQTELLTAIETFYQATSNSIYGISNDCLDVLNSSFNKLKEKNNKQLSNLKELCTFTKDSQDLLTKMLSIDIPKQFTINSIDPTKLIDFIHIKNKDEKKRLINDIKFLSDLKTTMEATSGLDSLVHVDKITCEQNKEKFITQIDKTLDDIETIFTDKLNEIETMIIPKKEDGLYYGYKNNLQKFITNPKELVYKKDICNTAHKNNSIDSVFCCFRAVTGETLVVWGTPTFTIECYDLAQEKIIKTVLNAHTNTIFSCRHYFDRKKKNNLIITSSYDRYVKVWDVQANWKNIVSIPQAHNGYYIYSVSILCEEKENKNYVISTAPNELSKVWSFKGEQLRTFGVSNESTYFIDVYFDIKTSQYYIINANSQDVKAYFFQTGELFRSYKATPQTWHMSAVVTDINKIPHLIESDGNGNIHLWEFHTGQLVKGILGGGIINLRGICVWNEEFVLSSGSDYQVKIYNIKSGEFVKGLASHSSTACSCVKVLHPLYGEALISHGLDGKLKLWVGSAQGK